MANKEKIVLHNEQLGDKEFDLSHAERLIKYQTKKGYDHWGVAKGQKYEIVNGALKSTTSAGDPKKA